LAVLTGKLSVLVILCCSCISVLCVEKVQTLVDQITVKYFEEEMAVRFCKKMFVDIWVK
jgi:hypothetical protein